MMHLKSLSAAAITATFVASSASAVTANAFANGGFEATTGPTADGWVPAAQGYTISNDARTGNNAALLSIDFPAAAVMLQNSVADGGQPDLIAGETASFSFWAKGNVSDTGNILYSLRFLDPGGAIILNTGNTFFQGSINPNSYTQIVHPDVVIPAGATAAFVEISQASGPAAIPGNVLIDDVVLSTVPEPTSLALLALGGLVVSRRRRSA